STGDGSMLHFRARAIGRLDLAILTAFAALAVFVAVATDREYMSRFGRQPARASKATRLPDWLKERRHDAIRPVHGASAILTTMGRGLAVIVLRRRTGAGCPGPFGPGAIAAILTGCVALDLAIRWGFPLAVIRLSGTGAPTTGRSDDLYSDWRF